MVFEVHKLSFPSLRLLVDWWNQGTSMPPRAASASQHSYRMDCRILDKSVPSPTVLFDFFLIIEVLVCSFRENFLSCCLWWRLLAQPEVEVGWGEVRGNVRWQANYKVFYSFPILHSLHAVDAWLPVTTPLLLATNFESYLLGIGLCMDLFYLMLCHRIWRWGQGKGAVEREGVGSFFGGFYLKGGRRGRR